MTWATLKAIALVLLPDRQSLLLLGYICLIGFFGWLESRVPAFASPPDRPRRWPTNLGIGLINTLLAMLAPVSAVLAAGWAQRNGYGLLNAAASPFWLVVLVTVLARSFAGYLFHVIMHKVPLFWRVHRVHHSDLHLDVTTAVRSHPLEFLGLFLIMVPAAVLLGMDPLVLAAYEIAEAAVNLAGHTNLRLPERLDRMLRLVFVTPNMHCLHHSSYHRETDSNYGTVLSIWDRLFGTYSAAPRAGYEGMEIGLKEIRGSEASDFLWQLRSPTIDLRRKPPKE